jgi:hypothetical protein
MERGENSEQRKGNAREKRGEKESERVKGKRENQRIRERQKGREEIIASDKQGGSEERRDGMRRKVMRKVCKF